MKESYFFFDRWAFEFALLRMADAWEGREKRPCPEDYTKHWTKVQ